MSEFLFVFRGSTRQGRSPEELQKSMQKWLAWFRELNEKGVVKDLGNPLEASGKVVRGHRKEVRSIGPDLSDTLRDDNERIPLECIVYAHQHVPINAKKVSTRC